MKSCNSSVKNKSKYEKTERVMWRTFFFFYFFIYFFFYFFFNFFFNFFFLLVVVDGTVGRSIVLPVGC